MNRKIFSTALAFVTIAAIATPASAYDFIIYTQNLLRFGHGSKNANKCTYIDTQMGNVDVAIFQEVMVNSPTPTCTAVPGTVGWQTLGPFGNGSYKEYYMLMYRSTARTGGPTIAYSGNYANATASYMRPPVAWLLTVTPNGSSTPKSVLVGDFHTVWGKTVGGRRTEVTNAAGFYTGLKTQVFGTTAPPSGGYSVIIGGDWNLPTTDSGFGALGTAGAVTEPNLASSLTRAGAQSQPYDHFSHTPTMTLGNMTLYPPSASWVWWRQNVSDHLGVTAEVTLP
jgi:hypothetical protein